MFQVNILFHSLERLTDFDYGLLHLPDLGIGRGLSTTKAYFLKACDPGSSLGIGRELSTTKAYFLKACDPGSIVNCQQRRLTS
jgi:hypothetical protein